MSDFSGSQNWELALKPSSMSFEEAAALPCAGITALACLRSHPHTGKAIDGRQ